MSITIEIEPEVEAKIRERAKQAGKNTTVYAAEVLREALSHQSGNATAHEGALAVLLNQTPEEKAEMHRRARALSIPGRPLPEGKTLEDVIVGQCDRYPIASERLFQAYAAIDDFSRRNGITMGKNDLWIAANSRVTGATLLTTDRDFDHLPMSLVLHERVSLQAR